MYITHFTQLLIGHNKALLKVFVFSLDMSIVESGHLQSDVFYDRAASREYLSLGFPSRSETNREDVKSLESLH